jgi:hypothetical protein
MVVTAHHDNSANNPMNPAPDKDVVWGELTSQEMMLPWFGVVVEGDAQPDMIASYKPGDFDGPVPAFEGSARKFNVSAACGPPPGDQTIASGLSATDWNIRFNVECEMVCCAMSIVLGQVTY